MKQATIPNRKERIKLLDVVHNKTAARAEPKWEKSWISYNIKIKKD